MIAVRAEQQVCPPHTVCSLPNATSKLLKLIQETRPVNQKQLTKSQHLMNAI